MTGIFGIAEDGDLLIVRSRRGLVQSTVCLEAFDKC